MVYYQKDHFTPMGLLLQSRWIILIVILWTLPWKGVALWKAARRSDTIWFIALLVLNTLGLLEIVYIFIWSRRKPSPVSD